MHVDVQLNRGSGAILSKAERVSALLEPPTSPEGRGMLTIANERSDSFLICDPEDLDNIILILTAIRAKANTEGSSDIREYVRDRSMGSGGNG